MDSGFKFRICCDDELKPGTDDLLTSMQRRIAIVNRFRLDFVDFAR